MLESLLCRVYNRINNFKNFMVPKKGLWMPVWSPYKHWRFHIITPFSHHLVHCTVPHFRYILWDMSRTHRITLCWYARTPKGWRYFVALIEKVHGMPQARHGWVKKDSGELVEYQTGRYVLRSHREGRRVYTPLETSNPRDAVVELQKARRAAIASGDTTSKQAVLKNAATAYIADCKAREAMEAHRDAKLVLSEFLPLCKGITYTRSLTRADILKYHTHLRANGNSDRTVANKHQRLLSFLRFAKVDLAFMPPKPRYTRKEPDAYTSAQSSAILAAADEHMRMVLLLGLKCGLRELEIAHASWTWIHWEDSVLRVSDNPKFDWKIKDKEERSVPIGADVMKALKARREMHPKSTLIVGTASDKPNYHLLRTLKRLARRAGLNCGKCDGCKAETQECEQWTLHRLRRTYATTLLRNGVDVRTVQEWCGWADLETALRYLKPAAAKESQDKVNAIVW